MKSKTFWVIKILAKDQPEDLPVFLTYRTRKDARLGLKNHNSARKKKLIRVSMHKALATPMGATLIISKTEY